MIASASSQAIETMLETENMMLTKQQEAKNHRTMARYFYDKGMEDRAKAHLIASDFLAPEKPKQKKKQLVEDEQPGLSCPGCSL